MGPRIHRFHDHDDAFDDLRKEMKRMKRELEEFDFIDEIPKHKEINSQKGIIKMLTFLFSGLIIALIFVMLLYIIASVIPDNAEKNMNKLIEQHQMEEPVDSPEGRPL